MNIYVNICALRDCNSLATEVQFLKARVTSVKSAKGLLRTGPNEYEYEYGQTSRPIYRTLGIPGSDKNYPCEAYDCHMLSL